MEHLCVTCTRSLRRQRVRHEVSRPILEARPRFAEYILEHMRIDQALLNDRQHICHRCWVAATRHEARLNELDMEPQDLPQNPEQPSVDVMSITGYKRSANTSNSCLFPNCRADNLVRVPRFIKSRMLVEYKLYIPPSARICHVHLTSNEWNELEELNNSSFTAEHLKDMLDMLRDACQQSRFNFDNIESITTSELHFYTGLNHEEFNRLLEQTPSISQRSQRPKTVLGAYLMKIRTGEPNERLSSRLDMSRRSLERKLELARECLTNEFVPRHLGWDHISREEIVARNSTIPNAIFGVDNEVPPAILICDGTYIYIQKSSNFLFQKQSYSLHKFRNLLKPFLLICTDGYIVDVTGPHAATTSDATIMNAYIENEMNPIHYVLHNNDTFVLDRGFRDAISTLQTWGYQAHMPPTKLRSENQLSTVEANKSRLVTIVRWVVEYYLPSDSMKWPSYARLQCERADERGRALKNFS
ncbi:hypothetical protein EVAR_11656_1 [Eumeta japonica]|uniref:DDE Tnp4 domain-containing protein n=1 Tax=Eumeta variegata TaxID=151549 RepID=A0A4C1WW87_EUMVA|nr:hypothetical protein EVAR_11656_1 [Eumeta japonica]